MSFAFRLVRVLVTAGITVSLLVVFAPSASAGHCPPGDPDCHDRQVKVGSTGVAGRAVVASNGKGGVRVLAGGQSSSVGVWRVAPACSFLPSDGTGSGPNACSNTTDLVCEVLATNEEGIQFRRMYSTAGADGTWLDRGTVCVGKGETPVSTDALFAQVRSYVDRLVPAAPNVNMQPAGTTIVRLPALFQAGQPADPGNRPTSKVFFANAGAPIAVNVTVTPNQWTWTLDGGTTTISRGYCCQYYTPAHSPRKNPDYYASHTFTDTGTHTATVTVTWTATMTIAGLGTVPVDGTFTRTSPAYPFAVKQARSQLESGG